MEAELSAAFHMMVISYQEIFRSYYPAHGSTGFTEQNLTVNYCNNFRAPDLTGLV